MGSRGCTPGTRGQTAPLGLMLVFAVMIVGATAVVALGAGAISSTQTQLDAERIENTMTQFDSEASLVALGQSGVQQVELSATASSGYTVDGSAGWMNLSYENRSTGVQTTVYNESMGAVTYEGRDGSRIAYQGGGVWRRDPEGSSSLMVSPPEFHYRNATLTLPLVTVSGEGTLNERAAVSRNSSRVYYPNRSLNSAFRNPLQNGEVTVTVQSDYYRAWGTYFEERTEGEVSYDHPKNRVTLRLVSPIEKRKITSATASLSASGSFVIRGSSISACGGSPTPYTDSYNSSGTSDDYCTQKSTGATGTNGDVVYGEDVDISSGAGSDEIMGDVTAGGSVIVGTGGGKPYVYGNISYSDNCTPSESDCASRITHPKGSVEQISGVQTVSSINGLVQDTADDAAADNDNGATVNVSSNRLDFGAAGPSDTVELYAGTYYLTEIDFTGGDELILNTTGGDVTLVVKENVELPDDTTIEVIDDGTASVYVEGTGGNANQLAMGKNSEITNDGDDAPQFRLYGQDNFTAAIGDGSGGNPARFVGVVYAPPGASGSGSVTLNGGIVYGGVLTGTTTIPTSGSGAIHYDDALQQNAVISRSDKIVKVTYIHASVNDVNVTSG